MTTVNGSDYIVVDNEQVIFPVGSATGDIQCINITIIGDDILEDDETFTVMNTEETVDFDLQADDEETITIVDNDGIL